MIGLVVAAIFLLDLLIPLSTINVYYYDYRRI
jgi:hypothetical protein